MEPWSLSQCLPFCRSKYPSAGTPICKTVLLWTYEISYIRFQILGAFRVLNPPYRCKQVISILIILCKNKNHKTRYYFWRNTKWTITKYAFGWESRWAWNYRQTNSVDPETISSRKFKYLRPMFSCTNGLRFSIHRCQVSFVNQLVWTKIKFLSPTRETRLRWSQFRSHELGIGNNRIWEIESKIKSTEWWHTSSQWNPDRYPLVVSPLWLERESCPSRVWHKFSRLHHPAQRHICAQSHFA